MMLTAGVIMPSPQRSDAPTIPSAISTEWFWRRAVSRRQQGGQGEDAAFTLVVGAHDDAGVLDGDDQQQRVEHQRQDAEYVLVCGADRVGTEEALADGVERAGPDVAVDDA